MCPPILKQIALELTLKYLVNDCVKFISVCMKKQLMMLGQSLLHVYSCDLYKEFFLQIWNKELMHNKNIELSNPNRIIESPDPFKCKSNFL